MRRERLKSCDARIQFLLEQLSSLLLQFQIAKNSTEDELKSDLGDDWEEAVSTGSKSIAFVIVGSVVEARHHLVKARKILEGAKSRIEKRRKL